MPKVLKGGLLMKRRIAPLPNPRRFRAGWLLGALLVGLNGCGSESDGNSSNRDGGALDSGHHDGMPADGAHHDGAEDSTLQNQPPNAAFTVTKLSAGKFQLDASPSQDPDGDPLNYAWSISTGETASGKITALTVSSPDCVSVTLEVTDSKGAGDLAKKSVGVPGLGEPGSLSGLPTKGAFLPRSKATGKHELELSLTKAGRLEEVESVVFDETAKKELSRESQPLCGAGPQKWTVSVPAGLRSYRLQVFGVDGGKKTPLGTTSDIVVGDAFFITGQSNSVAMRRPGASSAASFASPFVRSFGTRTSKAGGTQAAKASAAQADLAWRKAEGDADDGPGAVGQWGLVLGKLLAQRHSIAIAVISGGEGGRPVGYFQRNDKNPKDLGTNYGRLLYRADAAGLRSAVRAILFYQGEGDRKNYTWSLAATEHRKRFRDIRDDWRQDFPELERVYVTQIHYGCGSNVVNNPGNQSHRNIQRLLAVEDAKTGLMVTNGINGQLSDICHFGFKNGYLKLGEHYAALLSRDLFGASDKDVEPLDVATAKIVGGKVRVSLVGDFTKVIVDPGAVNDFTLGGYPARFSSVVAVGKDLILTPKAGVKLTPGVLVAYRGHTQAGPWVKNARGVGLATFELVPGQ